MKNPFNEASDGGTVKVFSEKKVGKLDGLYELSKITGEMVKHKENALEFKNLSDSAFKYADQVFCVKVDTSVLDNSTKLMEFATEFSKKNLEKDVHSEKGKSTPVYTCVLPSHGMIFMAKLKKEFSIDYGELGVVSPEDTVLDKELNGALERKALELYADNGGYPGMRMKLRKSIESLRTVWSVAHTVLDVKSPLQLLDKEGPFQSVFLDTYEIFSSILYREKGFRFYNGDGMVSIDSKDKKNSMIVKTADVFNKAVFHSSDKGAECTLDFLLD